MNAIVFGAILLAQVAPLPRLEDAAADAALRSPRTVHYDSRTIPAAYQHAGGFHSPSYNISADPTDSPLRHGEGGNANVQFPWQFGGGLDHAPDVKTSKAITLPEDGRHKPAVYRAIRNVGADRTCDGCGHGCAIAAIVDACRPRSDSRNLGSRSWPSDG